MSELMAKCGGECPFYDFLNHKCKISNDQKPVRSTCDYGYTFVEVSNITAGKTWDGKIPVDTSK